MRDLIPPPGPLRRPLNINRRTFLQALAGLTAAASMFSPLTPLGAAMPTSAAGGAGARAPGEAGGGGGGGGGGGRPGGAPARGGG
ncbi:twin-arginine translocation signal domain-containing protein, partial [Serratia ureilytica]|uniref:twin-arginine translocation signal domain-containing protein n=1 Tax=Serratia ureilytica TaxID=300181 RepID=UPI0018D7BDF3